LLPRYFTIYNDTNEDLTLEITPVDKRGSVRKVFLGPVNYGQTQTVEIPKKVSKKIKVYKVSATRDSVRILWRCQDGNEHRLYKIFRHFPIIRSILIMGGERLTMGEKCQKQFFYKMGKRGKKQEVEVEVF